MSRLLGFKWRGVHSSKFGGVKIKSRPVVAEVKESSFDLANYDGTLDMSDVNEFGRFFYQDKIFSFEIYITADTPTELQTKVGRAAAWLAGPGVLIFDDTPLVKWNGRVMAGVDMEYTRGARGCTISVSIRAKPFCELWRQAGAGVYLKADDILLGNDAVTIGGTDAISKEKKARSNTMNFVTFNTERSESYWITEAAAPMTAAVTLADTEDVIRKVAISVYKGAESIHTTFDVSDFTEGTGVRINCDPEAFSVNDNSYYTNRTAVGGRGWAMIHSGAEVIVTAYTKKYPDDFTHGGMEATITYTPRFFHNADSDILAGS